MAWNQFGFAPAPATAAPAAAAGGRFMHGRGIYAGNAEGGIARSLEGECGIEVRHGDGAEGNPTFRAIPSLTIVARQEIDFASGSAQLIPILREMDSVWIDRVGFYAFSAPPSPVLQGGLATTPPIAGEDQAPSFIVPLATRYNGWAGGLSVLCPVIVQSRRHPTAFWWRPSTPHPSPLTGMVEIWGMPIWMK